MRRLSRKTQISGAGSGGPVEGVWWSGQRRRAASADDDGEVRPHLEAPREGGRVRTAGGGCPARLSTLLHDGYCWTATAAASCSMAATADDDDGGGRELLHCWTAAG